MTRDELNIELKRLERYIDIYKIILSDSLCDCIVHIQDKYLELNKMELAFLERRKRALIPLTQESDDVLEDIVYIPIYKTC